MGIFDTMYQLVTGDYFPARRIKRAIDEGDFRSARKMSDKYDLYELMCEEAEILRAEGRHREARELKRF